MAHQKDSSGITKKQVLAETIRFQQYREKTVDEIIHQLHVYEKKYRMRSEIFFRLFVGTPLEHQGEFLDWIACYRQYFRTLQSLIIPFSC